MGFLDKVGVYIFFCISLGMISSFVSSIRPLTLWLYTLKLVFAELSLALGDGTGAGDGGQSSSSASLSVL